MMACFDSTYEGLKRSSCLRCCSSSKSFDSTYEGLKPADECFHLSLLSLGFDSTYEGLKQLPGDKNGVSREEVSTVPMRA